MKALIFLMLYFLTYSAAFAGVAVCIFARLRGGPSWLNLYLGWLVSAIGFMMIRNGGFFAKQFLGFTNIESTMSFYVLYMVTTALFLGFLAFNSIFLVMRSSMRLNVALTSVIAGIPLLFIPLIYILGGMNPDGGLKLLLVDIMMYYAFVVVDAVILFLVSSLKNIACPFTRSIIHADLYSGAVYVVLSVAQWFTYFDKPYSLDPFSVVNVSLFVMFLASTLVIGREYLIEDKSEAGSASLRLASADDGSVMEGLFAGVNAFDDALLSEKERKIVALIKRGATNQEIADAIGIKLPAVKSAIYRIFTRYGVSSRAGLIHALESRNGGNSRDSGNTRDGDAGTSGAGSAYAEAGEDRAAAAIAGRNDFAARKTDSVQ